MILCLGTTPVFQRSMVFERVTADAVNRAAAVHDYASGKSINAARVLHALGQETLAVGFAGGDRGDAMLAELGRVGLRHDFVTVNAETRQCVTVIDRAAGTATELVEESAAVSPDVWERLEQKVAELLPRASACVLSGSLPPGAPADFYARCIRLARGGKGPVVLDARGEPLRKALEFGTGRLVAKLNREELGMTLDAPLEGDEALREALRSLFDAGAGGGVVVTLGTAGAVGFDGRDLFRIRSPRVVAKSAVGSGDAFAAGLVLDLSRGRSLFDACAMGAACGAANAMTDLAGHLSSADVEALLPRVSVERF